MIDEYFNYCLGNLDYRTLRFENEILEDVDDYQGNAVFNYTDRETDYTRIIEHKHFEFNTCNGTVITREYPSDWKLGDEAYYPVNDEKNNTLFEKYKELAQGTVSLSKLKKYPLITMDKNTVARRSLDTFLGNVGVKLRPSIEVGSWDLMKRLVWRGMGVGVIPREYAARRIEDGELFEVKTDPVLPARSVGMLLPKDRSVSYALHCFLDYFREQV
jgi:hypothetical protein